MGLMKTGRLRTPRPQSDVDRVVYICHPYGEDPATNVASVRCLSRLMVEQGCLPLAPQLLLPQFIDESTERELAMGFCLRLVALCDEVRVYGAMSEGMRLEIAEAGRLGLPVVDGDSGELLADNGEPPRRAIARAVVQR